MELIPNTLVQNNPASRPSASAFVALGMLLSAPAFGAATRGGKFTIFDVHGAIGTYPISINNAGTIAGSYTSGVNVFHGFVRASDGKITKFDVHGAATTRPGGINARGRIAGTYADSNGTSHGFVRTADGGIKRFDVPNAAATYVAGINNAGSIVGDYLDSSGIGHGFIRNADGSFTVFDAKGDVSGTYPAAINDEGEVSGSYGVADATRGFVRLPDGRIEEFDADPKYQFQTESNSLNRSGTAAGIFIAKTGLFTGFLRLRDASVTTFDRKVCPFWTLPTGIDRTGQIAGTCVKSQTGGQYGFVRSPEGELSLFLVHGMDTQAAGINNAGVVFGIAFTHVLNSHGFVGTP